MNDFQNFLKNLIKIMVFSIFFSKRKKQSKFFVFLIGLLVCFSSLSFDKGFSEDLTQIEMTVNGKIRFSSGEIIPEKGLNVVLLKLVLDAEGQVTPAGPQGRVKTDVKGNFEFLRVIPDYRAGYQLGTRVNGKLYSTKVFFFKPGENRVERDILIPSITTDINKLEISQVSLVIESGLSSINVTEILSFFNSSPDGIVTDDQSLEYTLPEGMYNFSMVQSSLGPEIEHQIDDGKLILNHVFPPGSTQIIFLYNIRTWFGSLKIEKEFNHALDKVSIFTPSGQLQITSDQLIFSGKQQMQKTDFMTWKGKASDSNQLKFKISNVPVDSLEYIGVTLIILLLLFLSLIIFYRTRLIVRDRI